MTNSMKALTFSRFGGPEVLEYTDVKRPTVSDATVLVEMRAIGLNYADIYRRRGNYHLTGEPPYIAGYEGAGVVVESNSARYRVGESVGFADVPFANAEYVAVPESHVIPMPVGVSFDLAASVLLQGLTAHYLATDSYSVNAGDWVLVHAAAGGVGQILTQICALKKGRVIGLSRSERKLATILACKAEHAINLGDDWARRAIELAGGHGVDVAFDSVGATLVDSFKAVKDCGTVVFYGMSGGDPEPVDPRMLMDTSKSLTGGDLWSYLTSAEQRVRRANELFGWILRGDIAIAPAQKFALSAGRDAHEYLESGVGAGKVLLVPDAAS